MPEALLQKMSDDDIRALFHFLSSDQIVATAVPVEETLTNFEHRKWFSSLVNGHQGSPTTSPLIDTEEERCHQTGEPLSIFDAVSFKPINGRESRIVFLKDNSRAICYWFFQRLHLATTQNADHADAQ